MSVLTLNLSVFFSLLTLGFSLILFGVSAASAKRYAARKLAWVSLAFLALAAKGGYDTWISWMLHTDILPAALLDFLVLLFLYASVVAR